MKSKEFSSVETVIFTLFLFIACFLAVMAMPGSQQRPPSSSTTQPIPDINNMDLPYWPPGEGPAPAGYRTKLE